MIIELIIMLITLILAGLIYFIGVIVRIGLYTIIFIYDNQYLFFILTITILYLRMLHYKYKK